MITLNYVHTQLKLIVERIINIILQIRYWYYINNYINITPNNKQKYELAFKDDFEELDLSKWRTDFYSGVKYYETNPIREYFTDGVDYHKCENSILKLKASYEPHILPDGRIIPYTGALIDSNNFLNQQYGYFEIKCKLPQLPGVWPAFWLISDIDWPPEIDIFEFWSNKPKRCVMGHIYEVDDKKVGYNNKFHVDSEHFNLYGVEWTKNHLNFYINDILVRKLFINEDKFKYPMHMIINIAIHCNDDLTPFKNSRYPQYFEIDNVSVYNLKTKEKQ